jgi:hypothetical protein
MGELVAAPLGAKRHQWRRNVPSHELMRGLRGHHQTSRRLFCPTPTNLTYTHKPDSKHTMSEKPTTEKASKSTPR